MGFTSRRITNLITIAIVIIVSLLIVQASQSVSVYAADASDAVCGSLTEAGESCVGSQSRIQGVITFALNMLSWIAGIIAVVMLIISGLRFMTGGGDPQSISSAKRGVIYALVGIAVVILSQSIVRFVVNKSTETPPPVTSPAPPSGGGQIPI